MKNQVQILDVLLKRYYLELAVGDIVTYEELSGRFSDVDIPASTFFIHYYDSERDDRMELLGKIDLSFPGLDQKCRYRLWEMSRSFLGEFDRYYGELAPDLMLKEKIDYYADRTFFAEEYLYPEKYWDNGDYSTWEPIFH